MVKNKLNKKERKRRRYSDLFKSIILAIILWLFLPLRACFKVYPDFTGKVIQDCNWITVGQVILLDWFYYYDFSDNLYFSILTIITLSIFFIVSFSFVKLYKKVKNRFFVILIFMLIYLLVNLLFSLVLVSATTDSNLVNNGLSIQIDVLDTQELKINFVPGWLSRVMGNCNGVMEVIL